MMKISAGGNLSQVRNVQVQLEGVSRTFWHQCLWSCSSFSFLLTFPDWDVQMVQLGRLMLFLKRVTSWETGDLVNAAEVSAASVKSHRRSCDP